MLLTASACNREPTPAAVADGLPVSPAPIVRGAFLARTYQAKTGVMPYRLFVPKSYDSRQRHPLILWLHGGGGSGSDNEAQIGGDQVAGTHTWTTPERQAEHPAFVLVPQTASGWVPADKPDLAPNLAAVIEILDVVTAEFSIDERRIYVLGQSIGGRGVWNLVSNRPDLFAAAVVVCPVPGDITRVSRVVNLPIWIFQGDADGAPAVSGSRALVAALKAAGGRPRYTEYPKVGHDIWTRVFNEPEIVPWLFAQSR